MTIGDLRRSDVMQSAIARVLLLLCLPFGLHCGGGEGSDLEVQAPASRSATLVQTCAARTTRGVPIKGTICGGTFVTSGCEPGVLYQCQDQGTTNCTLLTACAVGCGTSPTQGADSCYSGAAPLTVTPASTAGGNEVTATVTLSDPHAKGAIDNMKIDRGDLIAARAFCNVLDVPGASSSVSFNMPTAVVSSATPVRTWTNLSFTTASGFSRQVVSRATTVTLQPGGTAPPPPAIASFTLTPASIAPGGVSFMDVTLTHMAPAQALPAPQGLPIQVTSSNPAVASVIGQPNITPGCAKGGGVATIQAASSVPQQTVVDIGASSGAAGQAPITNPLTVTASP